MYPEPNLPLWPYGKSLYIYKPYIYYIYSRYCPLIDVPSIHLYLYVPGSKLPMLGMAISPLIGIVIMGI